MIVGIDHVALSAENVDATVGALRAAGYELAFAERGLPNDACKQPLLRHWCPEHTIAYLRMPERPAIELTNYGSVTDAGPAGFQVLFGSVPPGATPMAGDSHVAAAWREALNCAEPRAFSAPALRATGWYDAGVRPTTGVIAVLAEVADADGAARFWQDAFRVGARRRATGAPRWAAVTVSAAQPHWTMPLVFVEHPRQRARLDDAGFACVALLTTNVGADLSTAEQCGATDSTGVFEVAVNQRRLRVAILRGRGGELIELVQIVPAA